MAEDKHEHGSMDVTEQQKTFEGFIRLSVWVACIAIALLFFIYLING